MNVIDISKSVSQRSYYLAVGQEMEKEVEKCLHDDRANGEREY